jgi:acyl-homoserine-lactone acylase
LGRRAGIALVVALCAALCVPSAAGAAKLKAKITRSAHGIPNIEAEDFRSLGFGYGYAFAQDNICTIADAYVTTRAERSRFFGPNAESPEGFTNLDSDLFYRRIIDRGIVEELVAERPPLGPKNAVRKVVSGYVKGYNRYLRKTGVENIPDPRCAGAEWVTPISEIDAYRRFYELALYASGGVAIDGIANAQPPAGGASAASFARARDAAETVTPAERDGIEELGKALDFGDDTGSNAWALGGDATAHGGGIVLGNPHFPWDGPRRFYQSHLTIPGKFNVSGASLYGAPVINIGHTANLAWSHTVSTAFRFTPYQLQLDPNDPTRYMVGGESVPMEADQVTVQVRQPDGTIAPVTRTLYSTRYGQITTSIQGQDLFPWTESSAFALWDANAENFGRLLNHFYEANKAQSTTELLEVLRKYEGIPWVNTIAADSRGRTLYADIGSIPNVPDSKATGCASAFGQVTFEAIGLPTLDGSRPECAPEQAPDALSPGIFGSESLPVLERSDYVANSNDSYWLANPEQPLEGFPRIIGDERTERSLRERLSLKMIEQRLAGTDGLRGNLFSRNQVRRLVFQNRHYGGELWRDELVAFCNANPTMIGEGGPVDVSEACGVLAAWDLRVNTDSQGALLFLRFLANGGGDFAGTFDVNDPVNTPVGLDTADTEEALADAVTDLRAASIPLNAPYGDHHWEVRGDERIPIHGGPGGQGVFNAIDGEWNPAAGYDSVGNGSSFVMVTSFEPGCVRDRSILTYSLSESAQSPFHGDQTRMYSDKRWVNPPFCRKQVEKAAESVKVLRAR